MPKLDTVALAVFIFFFILITVLGFVAARWRQGNLQQLNEWGLAGRRFGTVVTWFLLGGDLYTAYTFIAVPAAIFIQGAVGFFAVPYTILVYPLIFLLMPKFWTVCKQRGYITAADFVKDRFGSSTLAFLVAFTGILATLPYIALQMFGIQVSIAALHIPDIVVGGVNLDIPLIIAFVILAAYTYTSGLRAPAMIALVKDVMILTVVAVALIYIPQRLGGFGHIFAVAAAHQKAIAAATVAAKAAHTAPPTAFSEFLGTPSALTAYTTLALGSALALFLYPHSLTGVLSSNSRIAVKRNAALLPVYSLVLGLIALLGYMALALPKPPTNGNLAIPTLITSVGFPSWFIGFAFAAISIGALVPAAIMSIAAANLFTRNIYKEYIRRNCSEREETQAAKIFSLLLKFGALLFIIFVPTTNIISFQLLGGVWILQTLPPVFLGLYTHWFNRWAMVIGWVGGMVVGTLMAFSGILTGTAKALISAYPIAIGDLHIAVYAALAALVINLALCVVLTPIFRAVGLRSGKDITSPADYEYVVPLPAEPLKEALG